MHCWIIAVFCHEWHGNLSAVCLACCFVQTAILGRYRHKFIFFSPPFLIPDGRSARSDAGKRRGHEWQVTGQFATFSGQRLQLGRVSTCKITAYINVFVF